MQRFAGGWIGSEVGTRYLHAAYEGAHFPSDLQVTNPRLPIGTLGIKNCSPLHEARYA